MRLPIVYLETTILSYLTANPSRDLIVAAHQQLTSNWWAHRRQAFDLYVSELVIQELSEGDRDAAGKRLSGVEGLPILALTDAASRLAVRLVEEKAVPLAASADALHIAIAAAHGAHYLLTWNCRHIANAALRTRIDRTCRRAGFAAPILCTPEELQVDD